MSIPLEALESQVLRLSSADRARLLDRVVASLEVDAGRDEAWDKVAAAREAQAQADPSLVVSGDDVIEKLRQELK
jgi:Putative addiction module component